jgi:superfamily II DNA or RNA helicase
MHEQTANTVMSRTLSYKGYVLRKADLDEESLAKIQGDLTVSPRVQEYSNAQPPTFKLYQQNDAKIYVPKCYGLKNYGEAEDKLPLGADIDLDFKGDLRQEQLKPVQAFLDACKDPMRRGGILNLPCGFGKTTIALYLVCYLKKKAMVIVHKDFLLQQWVERIRQFVPDARIGTLKAKIIDVEDKDIVMASLQSLSMKSYDPNLFQSFGLCVVDEVHHTSAEVFSQALKKLNFKYSLGLSATVTRKDGLSKVFKWFLGDIVYRGAKRKDSGMRVVIKDYYDPDPEYSRVWVMYNKKPNMSKMINNICAYGPRNAFIVRCLAEVLAEEPERKTLVLSDRRGHLEVLKGLFEAEGVTCGLCYGGLKQEVIKASEACQVMLGTYAYVSEGFDVKTLNTMVLASPKSDIVQSVGRVTRQTSDERSYQPLVIDIADQFSMFPGLARKRIQYYTSQKYTIDQQEKPEQKRFETNGVYLFGDVEA